MKIIEIKSRNRRDFKAVYLCEHCGHQHEDHGYDDLYFHECVVPKMECQVCGKKASDDFEPLTPLYPEGKQV